MVERGKQRRGGRKSGEPDASEDVSGPKTTRPSANERRSAEMAVPTGAEAGRTYDAVPDRIDVRDWFYRATLAPLPDVIVNCDQVPLILDQGQEGGCTGYALAAVINFLLRRRVSDVCVSPRMLYEMARRYDEWPGEDYEGSSARGAMKGWVRHGVCSQDLWPAALTGPEHLNEQVADEARRFPGGAFYRVAHREVRDLHAALNDVGILYMTLMVHDGWVTPGPETVSVAYYEGGAVRTRDFPVIARADRAKSGHAVAIVGYTDQGFIVQNSWGADWGADGFALLPYEDYMLHATDVWVAQLGVPVRLDLWAQGLAFADSTAGLQRAAPIIPLADIRPFTIDVGNNGELSRSGDYWTTEADIARLIGETIPARTAGWAKRRILLYLHGGLNDERAVARRVIAFRDVLLANEIYPLHIMWESGAVEVIRQMLADLTASADDRAGAAWLRTLRDGMLDARDWTLELTAAVPGGALWREMKENARLSARHPDARGATELLAAQVRRAVTALPAAEKRKWELHVVGHSAGSIYAAYGLRHMVDCGIPLRTVQFMAPAISAELFGTEVAPLIEQGVCPLPQLYVLSDTGERDDDVGPYGKSLLYLVSNAFEKRRSTPLVGMERFLRLTALKDNEALIVPELARLFAETMVVAGEPADARKLSSQSDSHGGFDNDPATMNSVVRQILGGAPRRSFETRDLQF